MQVKAMFGYTSRPNPANTAILKLPALQFPRHDPVHKQLGDLFGSTWTPYFQWRELIMGLSWIFLLLAMKHIGNMHKCVHLSPVLLGVKLKLADESMEGLSWSADVWGAQRRRLVYVRAVGPLTVTILSIAICNIFHLYRPPYNIRVVGSVPKVGHSSLTGNPDLAPVRWARIEARLKVCAGVRRREVGVRSFAFCAGPARRDCDLVVPK